MSVAAQQGVQGVAHIPGAVYSVGVATLTLFAVPLQSWVYLSAILSALLSAGFTAWKWHREAREAKAPKPTVPPAK